ncbi:MAG: hypothetical protein KGM47_10650 [Acidobacteriota bacterium]|nr:hypothetical protein [Acidobacteriota bacterium]
MNILAFGLLLANFAFPPVSIRTATLRPATLAAFQKYVQAAEARIAKEEHDPDDFLYFDRLPAARRRAIIQSLKQGQVFITKMTTQDSSGHEISVPDGLIHHWLGIAFVPGISLRRVLDTVEDYNHQQYDYAPQVVRSRLLARHGNDFKVYLRLREQKIITITLDTWHDVRYARLDATHVSSRSISTRIQEVENAGEKDEYLLPPGRDGGFLWRINSYWRFEERGGGVYVECESISLTRDIPTGFGWLVGPFVNSIPRETLESTLTDTRAAVLKRR